MSERPSAAWPSGAVRATRLALVLGPLVLWAAVRSRPPWGDEAHFLGTVRLFGQGISVDLLRTYPEMSAPLTYVLYAAWGRLAGFGTPELRLLSPVIASATGLLWFAFLKDHLRSRLAVSMSLATLVLNPYFIGLSVFVFTDMLALLGLGIVAYAVGRRRPALAAAGLAVATCARQYLAFLALGMVATALLSCNERDGIGRRVWPALAGLVPLGLLVLLWGGQLAPANALRSTYLSEGLRFDFHALSLYLSAPAVYLCVLIVPMARRASWLVALCGLGVGLVLWAFPVQPSVAQTREGIVTVGFLHRAAESWLPETGVIALFAVLGMLNGTAMARGAMAAATSWRSHGLRDSELLMWMGTVAFLLVMPFSYLPWEKYALPLFMTQGAALAMFMDRDDRRSANSALPS